jgi:hypothetical protein
VSRWFAPLPENPSLLQRLRAMPLMQALAAGFLVIWFLFPAFVGFVLYS